MVKALNDVPVSFHRPFEDKMYSKNFVLPLLLFLVVFLASPSVVLAGDGGAGFSSLSSAAQFAVAGLVLIVLSFFICGCDGFLCAALGVVLEIGAALIKVHSILCWISDQIM